MMIPSSIVLPDAPKRTQATAWGNYDTYDMGDDVLGPIYYGATLPISRMMRLLS